MRHAGSASAVLLFVLLAACAPQAETADPPGPEASQEPPRVLEVEPSSTAETGTSPEDGSALQPVDEEPMPAVEPPVETEPAVETQPEPVPVPEPVPEPQPKAEPEPEPAPPAPPAGLTVVDPGGEIEVGATVAGITRIGATKCKICHKVQFASWAESGHGTRTPPLDCEGCHGPGSGYKSKKVMEDPEAARAAGMVIPGRAFCEQCHTGAWNDELPAQAHAHKDDG